MGCGGCCFEPTIPDRTADPDAHVVRKYNANGNVLWSRDLAYLKPAYYHITATRVYVRMESVINGGVYPDWTVSKLYCLNNSDGSIIWSSPELTGGTGKFFVLSDGSVVVDAFLSSDYPGTSRPPAQLNFIRFDGNGSTIYNVNPYLLAEDRPSTSGMICLTATDQIINHGWLDSSGVSHGSEPNFIFFDAVNGTNGAVFNPLRTVPGGDLTADDLFLQDYIDDTTYANSGVVQLLGGSLFFASQSASAVNLVIPLNASGVRSFSYETHDLAGAAVKTVGSYNGDTTDVYRPPLANPYGGAVNYNGDENGPWTRNNLVRYGRLAEWHISTFVGDYSASTFNPTADAQYASDLRVVPLFDVGLGWAESMCQAILGVSNTLDQVVPEQNNITQWTIIGPSYKTAYIPSGPAPTYTGTEYLDYDTWENTSEYTSIPMAEQSVVSSDGFVWQRFIQNPGRYADYSADLPGMNELAVFNWKAGDRLAESVFYADFSGTTLDISGLTLHSTRANRGLINKSLLAMRGADNKLYFITQTGITGTVTEVTLDGPIIPADGSTPDGLTYSFGAESWNFPYAVLPGSEIAGVFAYGGFYYIAAVNSLGSFLWASKWGWGSYGAANAKPIAGQFNLDGTLVIFGERAYDVAPPPWLQKV